MLEQNKIYLGDCLDLMKQIDDKSISIVLCDLPFGTTRNHWDSMIPLDELWMHYERIIKDNGAIVLFAQTPFDKILGCSNLKLLKYEWIWEKEQGTGFLNANFAPLKSHENILVFSKSAACYVKDKSTAMIYNPQMQGTEKRKIKRKNKPQTTTNYDFSMQPTESEYTGRHPTSILYFPRDKEKLHPCQKPIALLEFLIRSYTNEGDLALDNCMGSGSTIIACKNTNRNYIGIEKDEQIYKIAYNRINGFIYE